MRSSRDSTAISASILAEMTTAAAPSCLGPGLDLSRKRIAVRRGSLIDIADIEHRQRGQQAEHVKGLLFLGLALGQPRRLAVAQQRQRAA